MKIKLYALIFILLSVILCESSTCTSTGPIEYEMVFVEGGSFRMGATAEQGDEFCADERPVHYMKINNFYIGKFEVTQEQWKRVMGENPSYFKGSDLPVEKVSWNDVQLFIEKLNLMTGKKYRLPREAEWEYAARGGKRCGGYKFSGANSTNDIGWVVTNSEETTHPVGSISYPNELGIYDMTGNVSEWCSDWYGLYSENPKYNINGPQKGKTRVIRGGSYCYYAESCRNAARGNCYPSIRMRDLGFRLAMDSD